jgi:hypothetical protein
MINDFYASFNLGKEPLNVLWTLQQSNLYYLEYSKLITVMNAKVI